jgi:hypothetical protein
VDGTLFIIRSRRQQFVQLGDYAFDAYAFVITGSCKQGVSQPEFHGSESRLAIDKYDWRRGVSIMLAVVKDVK